MQTKWNSMSLVSLYSKLVVQHMVGREKVDQPCRKWSRCLQTIARLSSNASMCEYSTLCFTEQYATDKKMSGDTVSHVAGCSIAGFVVLITYAALPLCLSGQEQDETLNRYIFIRKVTLINLCLKKYWNYIFSCIRNLVNYLCTIQ